MITCSRSTPRPGQQRGQLARAAAVGAVQAGEPLTADAMTMSGAAVDAIDLDGTSGRQLPPEFGRGPAEHVEQISRWMDSEDDERRDASQRRKNHPNAGLGADTSSRARSAPS